MAQLILIRPGLTEYDQQSRIQGTLDIPLCDAGRKQAAEAAEVLRPYLPKALYCSPGTSAEETAELLGHALDLKPKTLDQLQNVNLGLWQGLVVEEIRRKQPKVYKQWQEHPETVQPPEGETLAQVNERVEEVLTKLARKHRGGAIVLIAAEPLASLIRQRVEGSEMGALWRAVNGCDHFDVLTLEASLPPKKAAVASQNGGATNGAVKPAAKEQSNGRPKIVYRGVPVEGH
jgi:broad specificity phosphatase PhoE